MIKDRDLKVLKQVLETIHPVDLVEMVERFEKRHIVLIFKLLSKEDAAEMFTHMNSEMQEELIHALNAEEIKEVMEELYLDDAVDILEEMPANVVDKLLAATDEYTRERINELLNYPEDSAGSIMNVEYITLRKEWTVEEAIKKIRQIGINKETIYTCYITEKRHLLGSVMLMDLLSSEDTKKISEIMDNNVITVHTHDNQEDVAKRTKRYGMMAIPVVDQEHCMVGIVTVDDAILVLQEEATEDINLMAAVLPSEDTYFATSVWRHASNRIPWLLFLMFSATITGLILTYYDPIIGVMPILVSCIPMIMGTGGNCGSQSSSLVIRGLAIDEIELEDWWKVLSKEIQVSLLVGGVLAIINILRVMLLYRDWILAFVISISLILTILVSKLIGASLPLLAKKLKLDPTIMAAPLITTLVDSGSMFILFQISTIMYL